MTLLVSIIVLTLSISFLTSLLEGFILSITTAEIEAIKHIDAKVGARLEHHKNEIELTTSAILSLNTLVNICGSSLIGYLSGKALGSTGVAIVTAVLTLVVLLFCEILPKNIGVLFRKPLRPILVPALDGVAFFMSPIALLCKRLMNLLLPARIRVTEEEREQEVLLLVNKGLRDGFFSTTEREIISNTLALDDRPIGNILIPLDRVYALSVDEGISGALRHIGTNRFSRLPLYEGTHIIGIIHRSDLLRAGALPKNDTSLRSVMQPVLRVNNDLSVADLMQSFLKNRQKFCIVETPAGQVLGIATLKDVIENLLGHTPARK